MHMCVPVSQMSQCHGVAADLCLGTSLAEDSGMCVCTHTWHIYRHKHGVRAGMGVCSCLGPCMEGWHSLGAMWGPGWQEDTCVLLCNAEPQVALMPVAPPIPPMLPVTPHPQAHSENMGQAMSRSALCKARRKVMPSSS